MGSKKFYDNIYRDNVSARSRTSFLYRRLKRFELNRYDLTARIAPGGEVLLDIGCGDGELLVLLSNRYKELWGIDIAQPRIERIANNLGSHDNIHVRVEDIEGKIGFKDGYFDTISAMGIIEHIFDPYHLMRECHRLLRPNGTLIVTVPNVAYIPNRIRLTLGKLPVTSTGVEGWDGGHLHYFTRTSLKRLFEEEGFEVIQITSSGIFAGLRSIWGSLLSGDILVKGIKK